MKRLLVTTAVLLAALLPTGAGAAGVTTAQLIETTARAAPSCLKWKVTGACFWLKCVWFKCSVKTSIRVAHFSPDMVVSTYHDPDKHPWTDWGQAVTNVTKNASPTLMGMSTDSSGSRTNEDRTDKNHRFRDVNAIGNPLAMLTALLGGSTVTTPAMIEMPGIGNLTGFMPSMGNVLSSWNALPNNSTTANARSVADLGSLVPSITSGLSSLLSSGGGSVAGQQADMSGVNVGDINSFPKFDMGGLGMPSSGFFCPPAVTPFWPYFDSQVDALVWRGRLPIELLYPASWIPGMRELTLSWPLSTWGNIYPRHGYTTQQHVVKNAALISQRVMDIVSRHNQPHFYVHPRIPSNGYKYFDGDRPITEGDGHHRWQRVYPAPQQSCGLFGGNDSASPVGYGDGAGSQEENYVFNFWRRYECCEIKGIFLFSIAFGF